MDIYTITEEDYKLLDLSSSPYKLDDMPVDAKELYLTIYSLYMKFFTQYIIDNTNLLDFDKELQEKSEIVSCIMGENKDTYQLLANDMLKYFYVRNNLYLHRLSSEELNILISKIQYNNYKYDKQMEKFIEKTYKRVTFEELDKNGQLVNYGPFTKDFFALNNSIVIGVRFEDSYDLDKMIEQNRIYMEIKEKLEKNIEKELGYNVSVLRYDNSSVKKKINIEKNNRI